MNLLQWICVVILALSPAAWAAEWQWSTQITGVVSSENNSHPRAFLWIPPDCKQVRGIVVGQHNMEEEPILEHPVFRKAMSEIGFAQIWITPALDMSFNVEKGINDHFNAMLASLAEASGYDELTRVPIVPIGHSAAASYPWYFAAANPARTLAVISTSGQWPYYRDDNSPRFEDRALDGIPGLVTLGEFEWANERWSQGAQQRQKNPRCALSMLGCEADGHFAALDDKVAYLALYIRKAAQYRLPDADPKPGDPVTLKPIDPTQTGYLADRYRQNAGPKSPAAPVAEYRGDPKEAFWYFDEELAKATEQFGAAHRGKKVAVLAYVQDGKPVPQNPKMHGQVPLKFIPLPEGDGTTFKLTGDFEPTVPEGRPVKWTGKKVGDPLDAPASKDQIEIERICGPMRKIAPDTFAIRFDRMGTDNTKRSNDLWFVMTHPGDDQFKRSVQQAQMRFPLKLNKGKDQTITFPPIKDQLAGTKSIKLSATSDAGAAVFYYVREGPAEVKEGTIELTTIPPRAKFPVKVTVVAWQWGRTIEPLLKSAEPVEQTFHIVRPGE